MRSEFTYGKIAAKNRKPILALRQAGQIQKKIAEITGKRFSIICRKLKHNDGKRGYHPGLPKIWPTNAKSNTGDYASSRNLSARK